MSYYTLLIILANKNINANVMVVDNIVNYKQDIKLCLLCYNIISRLYKMNIILIKRQLYALRHDYLTMNNLVTAAAILVAFSWAWGSVEAMQQNYELQRSIDNKRQQIEIEKIKVALLQYESKYYESDEYQELAVRQRTGKGQPGEKQLIVPSTDDSYEQQTATASVRSTPARSNFQQWMNFLFGGNSRNKK